MPIISIIDQPATNDLKAAYRPIVFKVRASRTDGNSHPPVVYCDIYVNGIYYKTTPKTQYVVLNVTDSDWQFDIQDALQEVLKAFLPANGASVVTEAASIIAMVYCKFRSSGYDANGFITPEGTAPIQGTGTIAPVAGTGTQSNSFYVPNVALQHEQNQNLSAHLNYYKTGTWASNVFPLTHRKNGYKICNGDSDFFPVINLSDKDLKCLVIHYKKKGDSNFSTQTYCPGAPCIPVVVPAFSFDHATKDVSYSKTITVTGTAPFEYSNVVAPSWMAVSVSGASITFHGTPGASDVGDDVPVSFDVANSCGSISVNKTIDVAATTCIPVGIVGTPVLPDGFVGVFYTYSFGLSGDANFTFGATTKPAWMNIGINETTKTVTLSGTPTAAVTDEPISLEITNCSSDSVLFADTIDIAMETVEITGSAANTGSRTVKVSLNQVVPCDVTFPILGTYDDNGTPTEFSANVTVLGNQLDGILYNAAPAVIICLKPTTSGDDKFIFSDTCGNTTYIFTLTIDNPC